MIRAVGFDLWETLITNTPEASQEQKRLRNERTEAILAASGHGAAAGRIDQAYHAQWDRCQELYWSSDRDIPTRRQIEHFLEELELRIEDEETLAALEHAYAHATVEVPPRLVDGAAEVLAGLKARGLRIGLISNTGRTPGSALRLVLDRLGVSQFIDVMVFSNEHGLCKPEKSIFEELRRGLGVHYEEMVFVGDNLYVDVHGAQRCGMRAIHFLPPRRGTAVAPPVDHGLEITPHAAVNDLRDVLSLVP